MDGIKTYLAVAAVLLFCIASFAIGAHPLVAAQNAFLALGLGGLRYKVEINQRLSLGKFALGEILKTKPWFVWATQAITIIVTLFCYVLRLQGGETALQFIAISFAIAFLATGVEKASNAIRGPG